MATQKIDYKKAGVHIDEGSKLIEDISTAVAATARPGAEALLGGFGAVFDLAQLNYKDPLLISSTDGVGTKLKIASIMNDHSTIGQDLVAMCVNDIIAQGAQPLFFLDYFATGKLNRACANKVIGSIAAACKKAGCALIGGETAEMPGMYNAGEYDLAGFVVGIVERENFLPNIEKIKAGDIIIGLESSGVHSNGFSLIRTIIQEGGLVYDQPAPFDMNKKLGTALLEPTTIYSNAVIPLCNEQKIKAIAHITGGGLIENIPRVLPHDMAAQLDHAAWPRQAVFEWIKESAQLEEYDMYRTFNCGIGMILITDAARADEILAHLHNTEFKAHAIGTINKRKSNAIMIG